MTTISKTVVGAFVALSALLAAGPSQAAKGDCAQPQSVGASPNAADALAILKEAVGQVTACDPKPCICDVNGNGSVQAVDALIVLRKAVGQAVTLNCKCVVTTTTSSTTSTSTSSTSTTLAAPLTWTEIQTVFATSCAGSVCHTGTGDQGAMSDLDMKAHAYSEMLDEDVDCSPSSFTKRVVPGNPAQSFLMAKLDGTQDCKDKMPLIGQPLSQEFRDGVRAWILAGAPNN